MNSTLKSHKEIGKSEKDKNDYAHKEADSNHQKYLGSTGLIALLALFTAFVAVSTDVYLPAIPGMADYFQVSSSLTNLTLILFFAFFALGMLLWGPISDKYGRRPILITGLIIYIAASAACASSQNIYQLIFSRVIQAIGGSAASAVATAIVKDLYSEKKRESILAIVFSLGVISPIISPVIGAFMLPYTSWRGIFWLLTIVGVFSITGCFLLKETIYYKNNCDIIESMRKLGMVLKNPTFTALLINFSIIGVAPLLFISCSAYIYLKGFGLTPLAYSGYFALNAVGMISGPILYLWLSKHFSRKSIIFFCFGTIMASGALAYFFGNLSPMLFALAIFPATMMSNCVRPPGTSLMLETHKKNAGSVSGLINCFGLMFASVGVLLSAVYEMSISLVGAVTMLVGLFSLLGWVLISKYFTR